jgi:hypothetical protein
MSKTLAITLTAIVAAALLLATYNPVSEPQPQQPTKMEMPAIFTTDCTEALEIECAVDIERTVRACAAAFESAGANIIADIKCAKDLMADKKHCWPCICAEAKKRGWHVIGC